MSDLTTAAVREVYARCVRCGALVRVEATVEEHAGCFGRLDVVLEVPAAGTTLAQAADLARVTGEIAAASAVRHERDADAYKLAARDAYRAYCAAWRRASKAERRGLACNAGVIG